MKTNFSLLLFLIMFFSSYYMAFSPARFITVLVSVLAILYFIALKKNLIDYKPVSFIVIILFTFSSFISAIKNSDLELLFGAISIFVLYILLSIILPNLYTQKLIPKVQNGILYSHLLLLLISFSVSKGVSYPFKGLFANPNSMGILLTTLNVVLISVFWQKIYNRHLTAARSYTQSFIPLTISILLIFYLTVQTGSRTSILITLIILSSPLPLFLIQMIARKGLVKTLLASFLFIITALITWLLIKLTPLYTSLIDIFYYKFYLKSQIGSVTSGRDTIWAETLSKSSFFGGGRDFFANQIGIAGHNTFISIIGQYGYIPAILFLIFCVVVFVHSVRYMLIKDANEYRYLPFMLVSSFLIFSMAESMMYKTPMITLFVFAGLISKYSPLVSKG